ncbi:DUF2946 family protein [Neorhizobium sp. NCHU2750]|uniref:DUF2946 family protein n=1 Tax=Neorhizobium sp. NCHU2750 TaxID=1825976 RepID=UPI000E76AA73|nr:hypothetical protein NCHU2750_26160 [Neorhizobium sp. NCHU2750]
MRMFRRLIDEGLCGGPLAALIGVLMAMQALVGGFGSGAMALAEMSGQVICASDGSSRLLDDDDRLHAYGDDDSRGTAHGASHAPHPERGNDCCLTSCQINASVHIGLLAKAPLPVVMAAARPLLLQVLRDASVPPRHFDDHRRARGPPVLPS